MDLMDSGWFWWALALALFALEAMLPGTFMLWLGFAAAATGVVHLLLPSLGPAGQWIVFGAFALVAVALGWRWRSRNPPGPTDQPLLNKRAEQLIGRVFPLESAIRDGRGRLKIGDAFWTVEGDDTPAGTRVRIVAVDGMTLRVHAV
jgi:membrane protein implicated in regulation of membrane protease activity